MRPGCINSTKRILTLPHTLKPEGMLLRRSVFQEVGQLGDFLTDSQFGRAVSPCGPSPSPGFPAIAPSPAPAPPGGSQATAPPADLPPPIPGVPLPAIVAPPQGAVPTITTSPPAAAPLVPAGAAGSPSGADESGSRQSPAKTAIPERAPPLASTPPLGTPAASAALGEPWSASPGPAHAVEDALMVGNASVKGPRLGSTRTPGLKPTPRYTLSSMLDQGWVTPPGPAPWLPAVPPATAEQEAFQLLTTNQSNGIPLDLALQLGLPLCIPAKLGNGSVCVPVLTSAAGHGNASAFNTSAGVAIATQQPLTLVPLDDLAMAPSALPQVLPVSSLLCTLVQGWLRS